MKAQFISLEMLIAIIIFSSAFSLFLIKVTAAQQAVNQQYTYLGDKMAAEARTQGVVYQIDKINPDITTAEGMLNGSIPYGYQILPFDESPSPTTQTINRVITLQGSLYDLEVFFNESAIQH